MAATQTCAQQQTTAPREQPSKTGLEATVERLIDQRPELRIADPSPGEPTWHMMPDQWGQPPAEDYSVERVEKPFCGPALRTRREHEVYDAIKATGSRHWLERAPEGGIHVCVRSRLSGSVYRYQFGHRDSIVKLLRWEYKQTKRAERRATYERLAVEARANVDEEALYPDEPGDDELWGSYTGPARVATARRSD